MAFLTDAHQQQYLLAAAEADMISDQVEDGQGSQQFSITYSNFPL